MGIGDSPELRAKKAAAGRLGAKARQETLKRAAEAKRIAADKSLDEQGLQDELTKLRQELGVISYQQKALNESRHLEQHVPGSTEYTEFIDLGQSVLSGILWAKKYPQSWGDLQEKYIEDEDGNHVLKPVADRHYFDIAPDWACERMMGIAHYEYELPTQLSHFMIKVFEQFLIWAGNHLKEKLDYLPDIAQALEDLKAGKQLFDQELHDRIIESEERERKQHCVDISNFPSDLKQALLTGKPLDVLQLRQYMTLSLQQKNLPDRQRKQYEEALRIPPEQEHELMTMPDPMIRSLSASYQPPSFDYLDQAARDYLRNDRRF
jgi:hypothetical protein